MFQSYRPEHIRVDEETKRVYAKLFCVDCEVKIRTDELNHWFTEEQKRKAGEDYNTPLRVQKELKAKNKESWHARATHMINAKISLKVLKDIHDKPERPAITYAQCMKVMEENYHEDNDLSPWCLVCSPCGARYFGCRGKR